MNEAFDQSGATWNYPRVGRWGITALPPGWLFVEGFGIRQDVLEPNQIVANISLVQDALPQDKTLAEYIAKQSDLIQKNHKEVKLAGPQPSPFPGADEGLMLLVRHSVAYQVDMLHVQNYVRLGDWIGIVTLTAHEAQLRAVRPDHDFFVKGLCILPPPPPEPSADPGMVA